MTTTPGLLCQKCETPMDPNRISGGYIVCAPCNAELAQIYCRVCKQKTYAYWWSIHWSITKHGAPRVNLRFTCIAGHTASRLLPRYVVDPEGMREGPLAWKEIPWETISTAFTLATAVSHYHLQKRDLSIIEFYEAGIPPKSIAELYGLSQKHIYKITGGRTRRSEPPGEGETVARAADLKAGQGRKKRGRPRKRKP